MNAVSKRYLRRFALAMGAYLVLLIAGLVWTNSLDADSPLRFVAVALPVPAIIAVAWAVYRYVVEADEMVSRNLVRSLAMGFAGGSLLTFSYGLFQIAGAPQISWLFVWPVYALCWAIAAAITSFQTR